jgi:hypothetical protein
MAKRVVEHEIKLEKSVKIILGIFAVGVFLNAFAPVFDVKDAFAGNGDRFTPLYIICKRSGLGREHLLPITATSNLTTNPEKVYENHYICNSIFSSDGCS